MKKLKEQYKEWEQVIHKQNINLTVSKNSIKEDQERIIRLEEAKRELEEKVMILEGRIKYLEIEVEREKCSSAELEEIICILNENRKNLESELNLVKRQQVKKNSFEYF